MFQEWIAQLSVQRWCTAVSFCFRLGLWHHDGNLFVWRRTAACDSETKWSIQFWREVSIGWSHSSDRWLNFDIIDRNLLCIGEYAIGTKSCVALEIQDNQMSSFKFIENRRYIEHERKSWCLITASC
jgi:hypothetical protein